MMKAYSTILIAHEGGTVTLTLHRPEKLNALSLLMAEELMHALGDITRDAQAKVLVITGAGRAFSAGGDFGEFEQIQKNPKLAQKGARAFLDVNAAIRRLAIPTLAKLNGDVVGGACGIAMACDLRLAHEGVRFHFPFVKVGLSGSDAGVTYFLPRLVGLGQALRILLFGETVSAREAERLGLVQFVLPAPELDSKTKELADKLSHLPPLALAATKRASYYGLNQELESDFELEEQLQTLCFLSEEHQQAVRAFGEKKSKESKP
jgi:enoyl-CoA hydratase/carnithine racemase